MASIVRAPVNPEVLQWARVQAGYGVEQVAERLKQDSGVVEDWERGDKQPTINQLRTLGGLYRRTIAFFFLSQPPSDRATERPPDFRSRGDRQISVAILREISRADERRRHYMDLADYSDFKPGRWPDPPSLPSVGDDLERHPDEVAAALRNDLGVTLDEQIRWSSGGEALREWIRALERVGVLVFQMSRVPLADGRGLSLYRDPHPIILLNGADEVNGRIFTLFHELGHLLARNSGLCNVFDNAREEARCNNFAGEFLMPADRFIAALGHAPPLESIPHLAPAFSVSFSAVALRLRSFDLISQAEVDDQLATAQRIWTEAQNRQRARLKKGGPPHHKLHLRNLGESYVSVVLRAVDTDAITLTEAAHFLEAKLSTIERMRADLTAGEVARDLVLR